MPQGKMTVDDDDIISRMEEVGDPAYTTSEVADMVGVTTEGVRRRLEKLEEDDRVHSKKPSARTVMWWPDSHHEEDAFFA